MTAPSSTTFQRPDLGMAFREFDSEAARAGFIGLEVLPTFDVTETSSQNFSIWDRESIMKLRNVMRAASGGYNRIDAEFNQTSYTCKERGLEARVDDHQRNQFAYTGLQLEMAAVERVLYAVHLELENTIEAAIFNASTFTANDVTNEWNDDANGTPITDVRDAITSFKNQCGMLPTHIVFSDSVFRNLWTNAQILARITGMGQSRDPSLVLKSALSELWGLEVLCPAGSSSSQDTADAGLAASISDIWDDEYAFLFRKSEGFRPGLGLTFNYVGDGATINGGPSVEQYREDKIRSDIFRTRTDYDPKIIDTACGYLLGNITS